MAQQYNIFWFRRDLRLNDNAGLFHALKEGKPVIPVFIFDRNILDDLQNKSDRRVSFIHNELSQIHEELCQMGSALKVYYGKPEKIWKEIISEFEINAVFTNHDYEPYALKRDNAIAEFLKSKSIAFHTYKDQVIFEKGEVLKGDGNPYTVFTPYSKRWKAALEDSFLKPYPNKKHFGNFASLEGEKIISLEEMKFKQVDWPVPDKKIKNKLIEEYGEQRNFPGIRGTSQLGVHLRFGTISVRALAKQAHGLGETFLNELIWRDFYHMILHHFPHVVGNAFRAKYDRIPWRTDEKAFEAWCKGETGYPMVDAGMRELNNTGYMHNRVRMVVASFLTKHLLIDWRKGEAYFAEHLNDFDLAANNGGWQWASGSGCDAAPYFRVFNPESQLKKFDKDLTYVGKWVPEFLNEVEYIKPIVEHKAARLRAIATYKEALAGAV